jgi:putative transposase
MELARSTYYDRPQRAADDTAIVEAIFAVCDAFECYGYRRVGAALRQQGLVVNAKKIRRLMREHGLQPKVRRRFVATTDSDHDSPIFPNLAKDVASTGPNQLWVSDIIPAFAGTGSTSPCRAVSSMSPSSWMPGRA